MMPSIACGCLLCRYNRKTNGQIGRCFYNGTVELKARTVPVFAGIIVDQEVMTCEVFERCESYEEKPKE